MNVLYCQVGSIFFFHDLFDTALLVTTFAFFIFKEKKKKLFLLPGLCSPGGFSMNFDVGKKNDDLYIFHCANL